VRRSANSTMLFLISSACSLLLAPQRAGVSPYEQQQRHAQQWFASQMRERSRRRWIVAELYPDTNEMPARLADWGCDEELWAKVRSKRILIEWAQSGEEGKARERLEMLRNAPSVLSPAAAKASSAQRPAGKPMSRTYTREGDLTTPADEAQIERILADRIQAKLKRDYEEADALRDELRVAHSVEVFDKRRAWRLIGSRKRKPRSAPEQPRLTAELPPKLVEWGCDAELWAKIHSKGALLKLVSSGNEEYARRRIARMRELIAAGTDEATA